MVRRAGSPYSRGGAVALRRASLQLVEAVEYGGEADTEGERLFGAVFEQAADAIFLVDPDGRIWRANPATLELTGYTATEIVGLSLLDTYLPEERELGRQRLRPTADGSPLRFERLLLRKDGRPVPVDVATTWLPNGQRLSVMRDVSARAAAEEARRLDQDRLRVVFELSQAEATELGDLLDVALEKIVALTRSKYGYIYFYDESTEVFSLHAWSKGVMPDCSIADPRRRYDLDQTGLWGEAVRQRGPIVVNDYIAPNSLKRGLPPGHARLSRFLTVPVFNRGRIVAVAGVANKSTDYTDFDVNQLNQLMDAVWHIAERQRAEDGLRLLNQELERRVDERTRQLEHANAELEAANEELSAVNATLQKILGDQEQLQGELAYRALHDPLTGLGNRTMFHERLDHAFRVTKRGVGILWIDLDKFNEVNDIFGHEVGDEMLVAVADRLREVLRERDDIARLGGDEFAVVLPNVIELEAEAIGERVLAALTNRDAFRLQIGASVGVAWQRSGEQDKRLLMRRADEAMYRAKAGGGGRTVLDEADRQPGPVPARNIH